MTLPPVSAFVQHLAFELSDDAPDSFEGFKAMVSPMFNVTRLHPDLPFGARVTTTFLPDIYLTSTEAGATRYERDAKTIAQTGTDAIVVLVYPTGGFTLTIDDRTEYVGSNEILFFDLQRPMAIQAERVDNISMVISRQRLEAFTSSVKDIHGLVLKSGAMRDLLLSHMQACVKLGARVPTADAAVISDLSIRMVAASWNSVSRHTSTTETQTGLASLADIKPFVENHLGDPDLGPALLIKEFSLSRATLYRLFEPIGGVAAYIQERRMNRAFQMLTGPASGKPRIKQLALELGFAHASAFSRAFKSRFGVSPQDMLRHQNIPQDANLMPWKIPAKVQPLVAQAVSSSKR